MASRAANLPTVDTPTIAAPRLMPRMFTAAARAIAAAEAPLAAKPCSTGSIPRVRRKYSPKTIAMPPTDAPRINTSWDQPYRKPVSRPHPSRRYV
jgi:hypothetical protein